MAEFRNLEKIESPEASAVNQTPEPKDVSERDREKLEKPSSRSMEPERKNLDRDEKKKLDPEDRRKVSPDMAERGKEQEKLEDPHKRLEKSTSPTKQMEQTDPDSNEKKKLNSDDARNVPSDVAKLKKEEVSKNIDDSELRKPLKEDIGRNDVREPEKTNENGAVSEDNPAHKGKNDTNAAKMLARQESAEDKDDGTDWERTSLTPEQEKIMREMVDNGEIDVPMERKDMPDPEQKSPHLPTEKTGTFLGEPGNSEFIPKDQKALDKMEEYGRNTVEYKNNYPDFSPFVQHDSPWGPLNGEVEIPHMTDSRENPQWDLGRRPKGTSHDPNYDLGNFAQADNELYNSLKDHYPDLKPEDIEKYRKENGLTWHECPDGKTMQLIPTEIHDACRHSGGVSEMKYRSACGDVERPED